MMKLTKRLAALLMVLALSLSGLGALAEAAPVLPVTPQAVFERGGSVKTEVTINVDTQVLGGLLGMFTGGSDESSKAILDTVLAAVNKLKVSTHSNATVTKMELGTEKGKLLDLVSSVDATAGQLAIVTSLLPGMKLSAPETMIKAALDSQQQLLQQTAQFAALALPYGEAVTTYFTGTIAPKAEIVTTLVEIQTVGSFDNQVNFVLDNQTLAGLLNAVLDVFKQDSKTQQLLDDYLKAAAEAPQAALATAGEAAGEVAVPEAPKSSADLIKEIDSEIAKLNEKPERKLANISVFTNTAGGSTYVTTEALSEEGKAEAMVTTLVTPKEGGSHLRVELISGQPQPEVSTDTTATAAPVEGPVDWQALKAGVLAGSNMETTLITLDLNNSADSASNQMLSDLALDLRLAGMAIAVAANGKNALSGDFGSTGTLSVSFMSPAPLLTVNYNASESKDAPELPATEGLKAVMLGESISEEDNKALGEVLMKQGLPQLLENLKVALPEESALLIPMIQQMLSPEPTQAN